MKMIITNRSGCQYRPPDKGLDCKTNILRQN